MKKFARYFLIWIILSILSGVGAYCWMNTHISPVYCSASQIYVITGVDSAASLRATDGGLKEDFSIVFKSADVITAAQKVAGTTEDLASYITVKTPADSNVIEVICENPDQLTAKKYVDAVVNSALKNSTIIPVEKMTILSAGTSTGESIKPNLYRYTVYLTAMAAFAWFFLELFLALTICAFKKKVDDDEEADYYRYFGSNAPRYEKGDKVPAYEKIPQNVEKEVIVKTPKPDLDEIKGDDDEEDDDLYIEETDIMEVDILGDIESDSESDIKHETSSAEVIGRIPK